VRDIVQDMDSGGGEAHALVGQKREQGFHFIKACDERIAELEKMLAHGRSEREEMVQFLEQNQVTLREEQRGATTSEKYEPTDLRTTYDRR
jgi:hypothetical protein